MCGGGAPGGPRGRAGRLRRGRRLPSDGVAKVGGTVITQAQLDARVKEIQAQYGDQVPTKEKDAKAFATFQNQVLEYMVTLEVVKQKAGRTQGQRHRLRRADADRPDQGDVQR